MTVNETWLCHYDLETKQQSMEWRHSGSPRPPKLRLQKSTGKILASIFWDQAGILLVDYLPKGQTMNVKYYLSLMAQLNDTLKENAAGRSPRRSWSCTTMPRLTGHLQLRRNWSSWASIVLNTHPILRIWPHRTTICSLDWKTIEWSPFFVRRGIHCCRGGLVGRTIFWFVLSGLQKLEQRAKKCTELRRE